MLVILTVSIELCASKLHRPLLTMGICFAG